MAKYQLGLKITHAYKPQPYQLKKHPDLYWIDVRTIDAHGNLQPLAIPRGYFSDSPVGSDDVEAYNISIQHNKNREIMYQLLKKYGFIHKNNNWEYKDAKRMRLCTLEIPVAWYGT